MRITVSRLHDELEHADQAGLLPLFEAAAAAHPGVSVETLLGVASRESGIGTLLDAAGTGDRGHGRGIMQIDDRWHGAFVNAHSNIDHAANIRYGAKLLAEELQRFNGNRQAALAAYNAGFSRVRNAIQAGRHPDTVTTGGDYSHDVLGRSAWAASWLFHRRTGGPAPPAGPVTEIGNLFQNLVGRLSSGTALTLGFMPNNGVCVGFSCPEQNTGQWQDPLQVPEGWDPTQAPVGLPGTSGNPFDWSGGPLINPQRWQWLWNLPEPGGATMGAGAAAGFPVWAGVIVAGAAAGIMLRHLMQR